MKNIIHYKIASIGNGEEDILLVDAKTTTFVIRDVLPSTKYTLKVIACAIKNKEERSDEVVHITQDPGKPENLTAINIDNGIKLTWTKPDYPAINCIKHYKVSCTLNGNESIHLVSSGTTSFVRPDVLPSTPYTLKVILCTINDIEMESGEVLHITADPGKPENLTAINIDNGIKLTWTKPDYPAINCIKHYKVSCTLNGNESIHLVSSGTTSFVIPNVLPSTPYTLKVILCTINNIEMESDEVLHITAGSKNLLIECNGYLVSCDVDSKVHNKIIHSDVFLEKDFSGEDVLDFAKLFFTSYHIARKNLPSTFWRYIFLPVIEKKDSNVCLFLLTIVNGMTTDQWEKCRQYVLDGLSRSMINQDKDTSKVIAWFVTKKCFQSLDKSIRENITDIWPAFICNCHTKQQVICSDKIEINIEINAYRPDLPDSFSKIDIHYIIDDRAQIKEGFQIHQHLQSSSGNIHSSNEATLSSIDARHLFIEHSNLSLVCKSPFKSNGFRKNEQKVIIQSCYQLYCKRKGFIPIGENHFPETLYGLKTDVLEGSPHYRSSLKVGNKIGTDEYKTGTLGGFVQVRGDIAFLTCLHVFLNAAELASDNLSLDDENKVPVKLYMDNDYTHICGKIREIAFAVDNEKETSIDAALVEIPADSIINSDYVDIEGGNISFNDIALDIVSLNKATVVYSIHLDLHIENG
ncbi:Hypothetical predicted protein [Mytilus galloprovincialis]|uniref:Fibronectin type-III domain-containing protein n=1 Tax=Mytilus galloprovincialis TaxID=29158 RepID=A0A8B6CG45_MYTGA|nr:Hypothetical predicted protein [Mytilus galloprovincialis]